MLIVIAAPLAFRPKPKIRIGIEHDRDGRDGHGGDTCCACASPAARSTVEKAMPKAMITFVGSVIQRKLCATW